MIEFIVPGAPRSANANPRSRRRWRERVISAARDSLLPGIPLADQNLRVIIIYFYIGETTLDVDNIAKSLLEALKGILFIDDGQVSQLTVRKTRVTSGLSLNGASLLLLGTIDVMSRTGSDFVYVCVDPAPDLSRIP